MTARLFTPSSGGLSQVGKLMGASSREGSEPHQGLLPLEPTLTSSGRSIGADLVFDCTGLGAALHTQLAEPLFPRPTADGAAQQGCQQQGREAAQGGEHRGREEDDGPSQQGDGESQQVVQGPGQAQAQGQAGPPQGTVSLSRGAPSEGQAAAAAAGSLRKGGIPVESTLQVGWGACTCLVLRVFSLRQTQPAAAQVQGQAGTLIAFTQPSTLCTVLPHRCAGTPASLHAGTWPPAHGSAPPTQQSCRWVGLCAPGITG